MELLSLQADVGLRGHCLNAPPSSSWSQSLANAGSNSFTLLFDVQPHFIYTEAASSPQLFIFCLAGPREIFALVSTGEGVICTYEFNDCDYQLTALVSASKCRCDFLFLQCFHLHNDISALWYRLTLLGLISMSLTTLPWKRWRKKRFD